MTVEAYQGVLRRCLELSGSDDGRGDAVFRLVLPCSCLAILASLVIIQFHIRLCLAEASDDSTWHRHRAIACTTEELRYSLHVLESGTAHGR